MNIQRWLWGGFCFAVGLFLIMLFLAVGTVSESRWWQRLNTKYFHSGVAIQSPSFDRTVRYSARIQWKREENGRSTLVHGIIVSDKIASKSSSSSDDPTQGFAGLQSSRRGMPADGPAVAIIPKGLYVNGTRMTTSENVRIFVLDEESVVHPIELTPAEMNLFQPSVYPHQLVKSALWKERFLPLLDPELIEREKRHADLQQEKRDFAALEARGIKTVRESAFYEDGMYYMSHWISYPDGTCPLLCAFITMRRPNNMGHYTSNQENGHYARLRDEIPVGKLQVFLEFYPSHYSINGQPIAPGKPYVQRPDGTFEAVNLTAEESQQFTRELLSSPDRFRTSDLFLRKIAPLIGPPIPKDTPAESAAQ